MIEAALEPYRDGNDNPVRVSTHEALEALHRKAEYYVNASGEMFLRRNA